VYTGRGKGKTTAAIGLCVRALGAGLSVFFGQFVKGMRYSEIVALETLAAAIDQKRSFEDGDLEASPARGPGVRLAPRLEIRQFGRGCFILREPEAADIEAARKGFQESREAMLSGRYDLVVLDEINIAVEKGLVEEAALLELVAEKPENAELVLTGRYARESVIEAADLVTEMRELKHYYSRGVEAREGIER